jgi:predicted anti-sigma-YlaC factor YlaD
MDYLKVILSGLAAMFIGQSVFFWPFLRSSKAIDAAALPVLLLESILSPRFWIVGILLFGLFYAASRGGALLRTLFFWIPTCVVSALGFSILAMYTYLFFAIPSRY